MLTFYIWLVCVIVLFGLVWHDEPSHPAPN